MSVDGGAARDAVNQSRGDGRPSVGGALALAASCQAETSPPETSAEDLERKNYIRQVLAKSKVAGKRLDRTASGFFVAADGSLLTTSAAVGDCAAISVSPFFNELVLAKLVAVDDAAGLALLQAEIAPPGTAILISSEGAFQRNPVYMLGYPVLDSITTEAALSPVSVLNSQQTARNVPAMLIDGDVRAGFNGGPMLDSGGGVIGMVTPAKTQTLSVTGAPADSMGLAIPSELLIKFLDRSGTAYRRGLQLSPKPADRILIDSRSFAAQVGCWQ